MLRPIGGAYQKRVTNDTYKISHGTLLSRRIIQDADNAEKKSTFETFSTPHDADCKLVRA